MESWSHGVKESWSHGVIESWIHGVMESRKPDTLQAEFGVDLLMTGVV